MKRAVACQVKCDICGEDADGVAIAIGGGAKRPPSLLEMCEPCISLVEQCRHDNYDYELPRRVNDYGPRWMEIRASILARDGNQCQDEGHKRAGGSKPDDNIVVHHIKPLREFNGDHETANQATNLITLCKQCHGRWHAELDRQAKAMQQ